MKSTRIIAITLTAIMAVTAFSGCEEKTRTNNSTAESAESEQEVISTPTVESSLDDVSSVPEAETTSVTKVSTKTETTKPAKTTEATTKTTEATTPATTKPVPEWTETKAEGKRYLAVSCYSRKKALLGAETVKLYDINDEVTVTAITDTGYYKLKDGTFIHSDYLSEEKVVMTTVVTTTTTTTTTATTPAPKPVPVTSTMKRENKPKPVQNGKYISSGYEPLDNIIFPLLDKLIKNNMSEDDKRLAIYDYLVGFQYKERTLLVPKNKKAYEEQLYAVSLFEKGYGICYDFSSAFKYMTKALGMNTKMYYGQHKSRNSGYTPHTWTMLEIDGMNYFYDPCMERVMINDGMGAGNYYRYKKPYYWFYDYYITDYITD